MTKGMRDWDDLRFFLAVARHGGVTAAAARLKVNHSTVSRRIAALEAATGAALFDRLPDGYALTAAGAAVLERAQTVEEAMAAVAMALSAHDTQLQGPLKVTAPVAFCTHVLTPLLAEFLRRHPAIEIALVPSDDVARLSRREADVAIRATRQPPENLVGRRLCGQATAVYGAHAYLAEIGRTGGPHRWVAGLDDGPPPAVEAAFPPVRTVCRVDGKLAALAAVKAGLGLGVLPCRLGDNDPALCRLPGFAPAPAPDIWLLIHPELRHLPRVRAFADYIYQAFKAEAVLFEGRARNEAA